MSWIKIEIQKSKACETAKNQVEQIDYEKIREITRAVIKAEIQEQQNNQPTPLTKEDIQEAVCNGVVQANNHEDSLNEEEKKIGFWKAVLMILCGKGSDNSSFATALLSGVLSVGFNVLFGLGVFVLAAAIWATVQQGFTMAWKCGHIFSNVVTLVFMALICVLLFLISVMFRGAANDIKREKDRNYIVALFSGIVSFVALIISIIALYRGGCGC